MKKRLLGLGLILLLVINVSALLTFAYNRWLRTPAQPSAANSAVAASFEKHLCLNGEQKQCIKDIRFSFNSETAKSGRRCRKKEGPWSRR